MEVYVAPFCEAVAEMTVAQLKLAASVDHLVKVGERFDRHLWSERWKRLPGSQDPSWLDWLRGGRHASPLELRRAAQRLQRELSTRLECEVAWDEDVALDATARQALSASSAPIGSGLHRLATRLRAGEPLLGDELVSLCEDAGEEAEPHAAAVGCDPAHPFVQLMHLDVGSVFVPAEFDEVLEGVPFTIGSAPRLARELERLHAEISPILAELHAEGSDRLPAQVAALEASLETLSRLAHASVERRLPMFVSSEPVMRRIDPTDVSGAQEP
jgi:hypothetical protein